MSISHKDCLPPLFIFIGLQGVGKTTIARNIAQKSALSWIDLDELILKKWGEENWTIREFFLKVGLQQFQKFERRLFFSILRKREVPTLLSIGGGAGLHLFQKGRPNMSSIIYLFEEENAFCDRMEKKYRGVAFDLLPGWLQIRCEKNVSFSRSIVADVWRERHSCYSTIATETVSLRSNQVEFDVNNIIEIRLQQWRAIVSAPV